MDDNMVDNITYILYYNNGSPPGVFIVFGTLLFFTITIHTATDKSADDVGNYYVELAET